MKTPSGDERDGDNRHTWYTNGLGQVVRTTWFGWYSESQTRSREIVSDIFKRELLKRSPLFRRLIDSHSNGGMMDPKHWIFLEGKTIKSAVEAGDDKLRLDFTDGSVYTIIACGTEEPFIDCDME